PMRHLIPFLLCSLCARPLLAQDGPPPDHIADIEQVSIEDLLNTEVQVTSKRPQTTRETSGVVTVITREEIQDSGAHDLIDVLQLVPGFSFGVDVEGVVSIGFRGNWGHEGKVLLLLDGQELN